MPRNGGGAASSAAGSGACGGGGADGSFSDGCIYPDEVIMEKGVAFNVRYTGCVEVKASMKALDFQTRTQVARECINRVCEAAGLKSAGKRRIDKKILQFIAERPCMQNAGTNVVINVSSRALTLLNAETGEMIVNHNMPRISFASGGDTDTLDFLAYIAKNENEWRACYVLECMGGQSEDLIVTIGKAFMLRYNALNKKTQTQPDNYNIGKENEKENEKDYYNDLPDKLPPDLLTDDEIPPHVQQQLLAQQQRADAAAGLPAKSFSQPRVTQLNLKKPRDRLSSNLIDLNSPPADQTTNKLSLGHFDVVKDTAGVGLAGQQQPQTQTHAQCQPPQHHHHQQQQQPHPQQTPQQQQTVRDVFDIPHFSLSAEVQRSQLMTESWFHGAISRPVAESLLINDGDFLVRESQGKHNQYVLTGLEGKSAKHLLLIDPEGVVRTKDRIFDSISHLINYHWTNALPIISEDSELVLRNPVPRRALQKQQQQQQQQPTTPSSSS